MNMKIRTVCVVMLLAACISALSAQTPVEENLRRADTQFDLYAYNTALNSYNEVLKIDPNNAQALGRKGDCYFQLNKPGEALPFYDRAVTLGRVDNEIVFRYAQALMQTGDYIGAKRWFNFYTDANPSVGQHYAAMCDYAVVTSQKTGMYSAKNELLNSPSADYSPAFYGNRIVFNSSRRDITRKSPKGEIGAGTNEIFVTQRNPEDGMLQRPGFLIADFQKSTFFNEGPVAFSASGTKVAFCHNKYVDGTRQIAAKGMEMSLYLADVDAEGKWVAVKPFPYNGSDYAIGFPWLSEDGQTVYFASNMPGGLGGWDLYSCTYNGVTSMWSTPRNLGASVNTAGNEITPFLDGNDLYFSSDWHNGIGGLDVFRADLTNNYASNVTNLGTGVNSSRDDYGFIYDSKASMGYFTSNRSEGKGNEDIWQVGRGMDEFAITVRDAYQQPIAGAEIDFSACGAGVMRTDAIGRYEFTTAKGQVNCNITVRAPGYPVKTVLINSSGEHNIAIAMGGNGIAPVQSSTSSVPSSSYNESLGSVVDHESRDPLYSVKVSALPWPNGASIDTYSNYNGQYTLNLEPAKAYTISFTKEGYGDMSTNFFSGAAGAQSTINQVSMTKVAKTSTSPWSAPDTRTGATPLYTPTYTPPATTPTYTAPSSGLPPLIYSAPQSNTPIYQPVELATPSSVKQVISGYSVQLAATPSGSREPDMSRFSKLSEEGNMYTVQDGTVSKLRLGVFSTKGEAEEVLKQAKTVRKDAFIIEEKGVNANLAVIPSAISDGYALVGGQKSPGLDNNIRVLPIAPAMQFAVQVKTTGLTEPVIMNQFADLSQFGNLYTRPDNGVIRIRVGVWNNQNDAELAQSLIMGRGYKEAVVVLEKPGTEVPVAPTPQIVTPLITPPVQPQPSVGNYSSFAPPSGGPAFTSVSGGSTLTSGGALPDLLSPSAYSTSNTGFKGINTEPLKVVYMVRICSLSGDPTKFDVKKAEKAGGKVDAREGQNGSVIMLLTAWPDMASATAAKNRLVLLGYKEAFVVKELEGDGILRRMTE